MNTGSLVSGGVAVGAVGVAAAVAWAGGQTSVLLGGVPLLALCAALAFGLQWLAFVPSYLKQTEKLYDLTGCVTYLSVLLGVAWFGPPLTPACGLLLLMCAVWALRLGSFLFLRIHQDGHDRRFNDIKTDFMRFLMAWTLQGLWVFLTLIAVLVVACSPVPHPVGAFTAVGMGLWLLGFAAEVVADRQKRAFKANPANAGQFIRTGLWAKSRHPNYAGEMVLWVGVFIAVLPVLHGWQWVAVLSPLFIVLLLTRVSGVPLLETHADERWGADPAYQAYKKSTPVLWPRFG